MKKLVLALMVSLSGIFVYAQDETIIEMQGKNGPYVTNSFWDSCDKVCSPQSHFKETILEV